MSGGWGVTATLRRIDPGQTFVWGKSPEMARALLAAAEDLGIDAMEVHAVGHGFIVPDPVWDAVAATHPAITDPDTEF